MKLFDKIFRKEEADPLPDLTMITRTETFEGFSIPGIILNWQYHYTNLQIYGDGLISCWEMVDLPMFKNKLNQNWVVTSIPDGEELSIFSLGNWIIENGRWTHTKESLYNYVYSLVKRINPTLENLHTYNGTNSKIVGKVNVAKHSLPTPRPYYYEEPDSFFPQRTSGKNFAIFFRNDDGKTYLAELSIYKSGHIELTNIPVKKTFRFENLKDLIDREQIATNLKPGEIVTIAGLGSFSIRSGSGIYMNFKYDEFLDTYNELNGKENSIDNCAGIFKAYKQNPTKDLKQALKDAYEAIPRHQRIFVGTMDTKDYEVRLVIYGDIVKKEFEEKYGYEYPFDDMPKPVDE